MTKLYFFGFILPVILSLLFTPVVMWIAKIVGAIDKPDERKIHKVPMPRLGGLSIFSSFIITFTLINILLPEYKFSDFLTSHNWSIIALSLLLILLLGAADDIWNLKPGQKFLIQFFAGALAYLAGFRFSSITFPFSTSTLNLEFLSFPITVLWVVGITNAFNLIDGLDGLASGIALIASLTISAIAAIHNDIDTSIIGIVLAGSLLGFLKYNFNPAKIFLGDSGSLFLGFILSILSIQGSTKGSTTFSIIIPLLALGLPIMDTTMAMMRRVLRWFLPEQSLAVSFAEKIHSMFLPDKSHIHHRLLSFGYSQRKSVSILYIISCAFGLSAVLVSAGTLNSAMIIILVGIAIAFAVRKLDYREIAIVKNGILLKAYRFAFLKHIGFQMFVDGLSIIAAIYFANLISPAVNFSKISWGYLSDIIIISLSLQSAAFIIGGLYKHKIPLIGLGDLLQLIKSTLIAVAICSGILYFVPFVSQKNIAVSALLDFYFLLTLVVGSRILFHALNYVFKRKTEKGKRILIYGADPRGLILLQALLNFNRRKACPVGFLDDDPDLEGKFLNGYPVFGGHWKLEGLLRKNLADEIIVAKEEMNLKVYDRIKKTANQYNIPIRVYKIRFKLVAHGSLNERESISVDQGVLNSSPI